MNHKKAHPAKTGKQRFLSGAHRKSTLVIGEALWSRLKDGPAVVNLSELSRETGFSRPTVYKALRFYERFGKILLIPRPHLGTNPGRPQKYQLNPLYISSQQKDVFLQPVNPSITPQEKTKAKTTKDEKRLLPEALNQKIRDLNDNELASDRSKRLAFAYIRRVIAPSSNVADGICGAIARRRKLSNADLKRILRLAYVSCEAEARKPDDFSYWQRVLSFALRGFDSSGEKISSLTEAMHGAFQRDITVAEALHYNETRLRGLEAFASKLGIHADHYDLWFELKRENGELKALVDDDLSDMKTWRMRVFDQIGCQDEDKGGEETLSNILSKAGLATPCLGFETDL